MMPIDASRRLAAMLIAAAATALPGLPAAAQCETDKLLASDPGPTDWFGRQLDIDGDRAVLGAYRSDNKVGEDVGSAYVFERPAGSADGWVQVRKISSFDGEGSDWFGWAVGVSGDTVVVSAQQDDDGGFEAGSAYVYRRDRGGLGAWGQVAKLTAFDPEENDRYGVSVAIDGETIAIGSYQDDDNGSDSGSVYVYGRDVGGPENWGLVTKLTASDADADDKFGFKVALDTDTLLVGAYQDDDEGIFTGSAYVFLRDLGGPDNWGESRKINPTNPINGETFGVALDVSGDVAIVGANGSATGSAYIFRRNTGGAENWGQVSQLIGSDTTGGDQLGSAVAIEGNMALVTAPLDDDDGNASGSAYIFRRDQGFPEIWFQDGKLTASDAAEIDFFGTSLAADGDTALIGAYRDDDGAEDAGSAYAFIVDGPDDNGNGTLDGCESCPSDLNGDGTVDVLDLIQVIVNWGDGIGVLDLIDVILAWGPC